MKNKQNNDSNELSLGRVILLILFAVLFMFLMFFAMEFFVSHDAIASFWFAAKILGYFLGGSVVILLVGSFFTSDPDEIMVVGVIALVVIGILYKVLRVIF